jgi:hypothetical protein
MLPTRARRRRAAHGARRYLVKRSQGHDSPAHGVMAVIVERSCGCPLLHAKREPPPTHTHTSSERFGYFTRSAHAAAPRSRLSRAAPLEFRIATDAGGRRTTRGRRPSMAAVRRRARDDARAAHRGGVDAVAHVRRRVQRPRRVAVAAGGAVLCGHGGHGVLLQLGRRRRHLGQRRLITCREIRDQGMVTCRETRDQHEGCMDGRRRDAESECMMEREL